MMPCPAMNSTGDRGLETSRLACRATALLVMFASMLSACSSNRPSDQAGSRSPAPVAPAIRPEPGSAPAEKGEAVSATPDALAPVDSADWRSLFDGTTLNGWRITPFGGHGEVTVENGALSIHEGAMLTGVSRTNKPAKTDYEVELEAQKTDGSDFFCGLTFPVGDDFCSLIVGGWGGGVVGLSSIDGMDASENETTKYMSFPKNRWYRIRLRVTRQKIQAWIDGEEVVNQSIVGRRLSRRAGDIYLSQPFGIATWQTSAAIRGIRFRELPAHP